VLIQVAAPLPLTVQQVLTLLPHRSPIRVRRVPPMLLCRHLVGLVTDSNPFQNQGPFGPFFCLQFLNGCHGFGRYSSGFLSSRFLWRIRVDIEACCLYLRLFACSLCRWVAFGNCFVFSEVARMTFCFVPDPGFVLPKTCRCQPVFASTFQVAY